MTKLTSNMSNVTIINDVTIKNDVTKQTDVIDLPPPPSDLLDDLPPPPPQNFPDPPTPTVASIPPPPPVVAAPKVSSSNFVSAIPFKPKKPQENPTPSKYATPYKPPTTVAKQTTPTVAKENAAPAKPVQSSAALYKPPSWPRSKGPTPSLADLIMQDDVNKGKSPVVEPLGNVNKQGDKSPVTKSPANKSPAVKSPPAFKSPAAPVKSPFAPANNIAAKPRNDSPPDFIATPNNSKRDDDVP